MDFKQIINKIGKKNLLIIVVAFLSLLSYCFASYMKVSMKAFGQSQSESAGFLSDILFEDGYLLVSLVGLLTIIAAIAIIVTAVLRKKELLLCTYAGAGLGVLSIIFTMIKAGSLEKEMASMMGGGSLFGGSIGYSVGTAWGLWFAVICLIGCAAIAHFVTEEDLEKAIAKAFAPQAPAAPAEFVPEESPAIEEVAVEEVVEETVEAAEAAEEQTQE